MSDCSVASSLAVAPQPSNDVDTAYHTVSEEIVRHEPGVESAFVRNVFSVRGRNELEFAACEISMT